MSDDSNWLRQEFLLDGFLFSVILALAANKRIEGNLPFIGDVLFVGVDYPIDAGVLSNIFLMLIFFLFLLLISSILPILLGNAYNSYEEYKKSKIK
jgi:hypothetical protein